jgi:hypothetical protein
VEFGKCPARPDKSVEAPDNTLAQAVGVIGRITCFSGCRITLPDNFGVGRLFFHRSSPIPLQATISLACWLFIQYKSPMNHRTPALHSTRLLDQVRKRARYLHYSLPTEKAYLYWVRFFVRWHGLGIHGTWARPRCRPFSPCWPRNGASAQRRVSSSTHNQALSALLFLYREVLEPPRRLGATHAG